MSTTQSATEPEQAPPPELLVTVMSDQLAAYLELSGGPPPTIDEALATLHEAHVIFGIEPSRVAAALQTPGRRVMVAAGVPAHQGQDGGVEYDPSLLTIGGRPQVDADGRVNLFDLGLMHNVEVGTLLATRTLPTTGASGTTVSGKSIPARPGRPSRVRAGAGAAFGEDNLQMFATTAGHATVVGEVVSVSAIYHVRGDVGPATGNIDFVGSVSVSGNVDAGYRVKAGGDVEIQGSVAGGEVEAAGNVSIRYGIRGHNGRGSVVAVGDVKAAFIEFAVVRAGGSIYASDGIIRSRVESGAKVEVLGQHGSIVGGHVVAREAVSARDLGSSHDIPTEIVVGADPALVAEAQESQVRARTLIDELEQVQRRVVHAQDQDRRVGASAPARQELAQLHLAYKALLDERAQLNLRQQEIGRLLQGMRSAEVVARGACHPHVRVTIGSSTHLVRDGWSSVSFKRNQTTFEIDLIALADTHHS